MPGGVDNQGATGTEDRQEEVSKIGRGKCRGRGGGAGAEDGQACRGRVRNGAVDRGPFTPRLARVVELVPSMGWLVEYG